MKQKLCQYLLCITAITAITACGDKSPFKQGVSADCSSEQTQALIPSLIKEQTEKFLKTDEKLNAPAFTNTFNKIDLSKARATVEQIKISVENIRTIKEDPNSTKKFCKATVKLTIPPELLSSIDKSVELVQTLDTKEKIFDLKKVAQDNGFEINANVATRDFEYNSQASDDKKQVFVELEQAKPLTTFVAFLSMVDQMANKIEAVVSEAKTQEAANQEAATATAKAELDSAQRNNSATRQQINNLWNSMPKDYQNALLAEQKAWVAQKKAQCGAVTAGETPDFNNPDSISKLIGKLNCDTGMTNQRYQVLISK